MVDDVISTLVPSSNRGRYALDDPAGHELTSGDRIAIQIGGEWIHGAVRHSKGYDAPGCYTIADRGRKNHEANKDAPPLTQEAAQRQVNAALAEGMSLQEALEATVARQVVDVFCGYYFEDDYGDVVGLCTGMRVILV